LVAPIPTQAEKIVQFKATFRNEIIPITIKTGERLSTTQLAKKNCLMLVLQGLKLTKPIEESLHEIKKIMGPKNVASSFFPKQRVKLHNGSVNIEYLNPTVYHQFVNKTHKIHNSHVTFTPHPKNLEGTLLPSKEQQKQFGFCDINSALVNTIEAIQNAPSNHKKKARVEDFNELKIELKTELKRELKAELTTDFKEKWPSKGKTSSSPQTPTLKGSIPTYKKS
jgi:ATP-dependent exoDNAse (exonuclease V) beta subunit